MDGTLCQDSDRFLDAMFDASDKFAGVAATEEYLSSSSGGLGCCGERHSDVVGYGERRGGDDVLHFWHSGLTGSDSRLCAHCFE